MAAVVCGVLAAAPAWAAEGPAMGDPKSWHRLVGILQYLQADYPAAVASGAESEQAEQASFAQEAVWAAAELGDPGKAFVPRLEELRRRVVAREDPAGVSRDCAELVEDLVLAGGLARSPRRPPSLEQGEALYAVNCAACHGKDGSAQVEIAATMEPKPANFRDPERMDQLTPYKAFNALSFGVTGTPMPSYTVLAEEERWSLAFYIFTLRQPPCDHAPPKLSLEALANTPDAALVSAHGKKELACLRRRLPDADEERSLVLARSRIEDALRMEAQGDAAGARQAILDAYLQGIEPIEPLLRARDPKLVQDLEAGFARTRLAAERSSPHLRDEARGLLTIVDRARKSRPAAQDFISVFWLALLILLREGFEATVVIAALLAVLKKMDQREHARVVHAGWISAAVVGALAFVFGRQLFRGANRELLEGAFALLAVGMLVYAALWLNARANMRRFMGQLRQRMQGALGRGSALGLFTIAFTAMLRESVETAVFLQGLSIDSPSGVTWGVVAGLVLLLGMVLLINRAGYVLPMKQLFNASTVLLLATAVVLLGKGLHALQEVGLLPLRPLGSFSVEPLGIWADVVTLIPQLLLTAAPILWILLRRRGSPSVPHDLPGADAKSKV